MKLIVHPAVQAEFNRKVAYLRLHGLLFDSSELFIDEIEEALEAIPDQLGRSRMPGAPAYFRVGPTARFSFSIIYQVFGKEIHVVARCTERRPGYWKRRRF